MNLETLLSWLDQFNFQSAIKAKPHPSLRSQVHQIRPLTDEQISLGKKSYSGPRRSRDSEFYRDRRTKKAVRKLPF